MPIINETIISGVNAKDATASSADILQDKTAVVGKKLITGAMKDHSGKLVTGVFDSGGSNYIRGKFPENGHYDTSSILQVPVANLVSGNIRSGVNIGGVIGTLSPTNVIVQQGITSFSLTITNNGSQGVAFRLMNGNSLTESGYNLIQPGKSKSFGTIYGQVVGLAQTSSDIGSISSASCSGGNRISAGLTASGIYSRSAVFAATSQSVTITL